MKIVHLCLSCFYIDNYSYQENMLPKYHVKQGHKVTVIASLVTFDSNGKPCLLEGESTTHTRDGYKVIRVDYKRPFYNINKFIRKYKNIYQLLQQEEPDLIFIHDFSFIDISRVISYVRKNRNVRVYVDCHTDYINSAQTWISKNFFHHFVWRTYAKLLSPYVKKFYGVTPLRCDFLRQAYNINSNKIELLVMGVDDDLLNSKNRLQIKTELYQRLGINESDFVIVTGGKIDSKKNIHLVIEAVNKMERDNIKLIVFGTIAPEMKACIEPMLKSSKIIYIDWQNADQILDLFLSGDLIVFPGTHSVLWEQAVGTGTPCLFKYWDGMTHVNVGGNCKFLYRDDVLEIKEVIDDILTYKDQYKTMKDIAMNKGLKEFSYSDIAYRSINE